MTLVQNKARGNDDMAIALFPGPSGISPENAELDDLLDQQLVTHDEGERRALVGRIQEIVARDLLVLPLAYSPHFFVFSKDLFQPWFATGIPQPHNKDAFVTGRTTGLEAD